MQHFSANISVNVKCVIKNGNRSGSLRFLQTFQLVGLLELLQCKSLQIRYYIIRFYVLNNYGKYSKLPMRHLPIEDYEKAFTCSTLRHISFFLKYL